jgi:thiol-disulfide isomerase/thioredoxin
MNRLSSRSIWVLVGLALLAGTACVKRDPLPNPSGPIGRVGTLATFSLPAYPGGEMYATASDRGNVVLLDVWATWCEPCRDALPTYEQLLKEYGAKGLKVYAINVDEDASLIPQFIKDTKLNLPILLDKNAALSERELGVKLMPTTFLVDRKGIIRFQHDGFAEEFLAKYQSEIEQLLGEPAE